MVRVAELTDEAERSDDPSRLAELGRHASKAVRRAVAHNPAASDDTIRRLLSDEDEGVRITSASNLGDREALQRVAVLSSEPLIRAALAYTFLWEKHRSLPYDVQARLSRDGFVESRRRTAETTNYLDLFELLLRDEHPKVRGACARNPRITRTQMESLVTDRVAGVRAACTGGVIFPDDEQLLRLARDRSAKVRWWVLFRVDRPREAVELIARDPDEFNRHHAQLALAHDHALMSPQVEENARSERRVASQLEPFLAPPD